MRGEQGRGHGVLPQSRAHPLCLGELFVQLVEFHPELELQAIDIRFEVCELMVHVPDLVDGRLDGLVQFGKKERPGDLNCLGTLSEFPESVLF